MRRLLDALGGARGAGLFALVALAALMGLLMIKPGGTSNRADGEETALERRVEAILECIDGVGEVDVMIAQDDSGAAVGAVVVAEGVGDVRAWLEVQSAVQALLALDAESIRVIGKNGLGGLAQ